MRCPHYNHLCSNRRLIARMSSIVPPGYRFYPTEEELTGFFLQNKLENRRQDMELVVPVVHVYCFDPWQLPAMAGEACRGDGVHWIFFCPRQQRETQGGRPTRTTPSGYWKATGSPSPVYSSANRALGVKRTMVFYRGRAPTGTKTEWKMNEYRALEQPSAANASPLPPRLRSEFSVCRVYTQSGYVRAFDRRPAAAQGAEEVAVTALRASTASFSHDSSLSSDGVGGEGSQHCFSAGAGAGENDVDGNDCFAASFWSGSE